MSKYDYVHTDFPNNVFNEDTLRAEVAADSTIEATLSRISSSEDLDTGVTTVSIYFTTDLSTEEQTALDAVVAEHTGEGPPSASPVILSRPDGEHVPISQDGGVRFAPTFEDTNDQQPNWEGHLYEAVAGATSIFDEEVTVEKQIRGGWYEIFGGPPVLGDYIEFSVVDKNDVLGLFSTYGLTVGEDVLELQKYVVKEYINPAHSGREVFMANSVWPLIPGLFMRTTLVSTGSDNINLKVVTLAYTAQ